MIELTDFIFETVHEDGELALSRGRREREPFAILVLAAVSEFPTFGTLDRLEHEYSLREVLDPNWAARPLALSRLQGRMALVLQDPGGTPLHRFIGQPMELTRFLRFAVGLATAVGRLHELGFIHKDIKPSNFLVDMATGRVWLTGFGIASPLPRQRQASEPPEVIAGTLAYMAPEQTGRMNRSIDSRSDLYSLGVTLYEMLTGVLPFTASDPLEWVHCHIARRPAAPHERVKDVPRPVSAILMKLLAKTAEERYQTALGLKSDFQWCLAEWELSGFIDAFPLGVHDTSDQLLIPEKLYGRESEIETLIAAFGRVAAHGRTELVLVSGYSGIGKSSVVNELHQALIPAGGFFAAGKFDQYKRDIPYMTLAQAFQSLVRQILGKNDADVSLWRDTLREALGPNGQLMIGLIPELELLIGVQPPVADLSPQDAQNRFQIVFLRFLGAFAQAEHPLALFLDDLQWLDIATLELLKRLVTDPDVHHLLLVGAYRDNEIRPSHPLARTLEEIRKTGNPVREIVLAPLSIEDIDQLVLDTLRCQPQQARLLVQLIHEKTGGNPFFAIQFLSTLAEEGLLVFNSKAAAWTWDLSRIHAKGFTDNVVVLMAGKLDRLPQATQEAVAQLACLGNSARTILLSMVLESSEEELHAVLLEAIRAGLVFEVGGAYAFVHDRVQEAAYALIPEELRARLHLRIGHSLIAKLTEDEIEEKIFDIINQLNLGRALISDLDEKDLVANLNLRAGLKAKASAAYDSACIYLSSGMGLLGSDAWERKYELAFNLWIERAESEYLNGNFDLAESMIAELMDQARSKVDQVAAYRLRILLHLLRGEYQLAVDRGLECLRIFDIDLPAHPTREQVHVEYEKIWRNLGDRSIESLIDLPSMTDPEIQAAMGVLSVIAAPAFNADINLMYFVFCRMVNASLEYGTTGASAHGYAEFATLLGPVFHRYLDGYRFGKLACGLIEKYGFDLFKAKVYFSMQRAMLWKEPISSAIEFIRLAIDAGVETHDMVFASFSWGHLVTALLLQGVRLDEVWRESEKGLDFVRKVRFRDEDGILTCQQRFILSLRGETVDSPGLSDARFNEETFEAQFGTARRPSVACHYWILELQVRYILGDYEAAILAARKAKALLWSAEQHIQSVDYCYYSALTAAALYETAGAERRAEMLELLAQSLKWLREWAESCPDTFLDRYTLGLAELARIEGRELDAMRFYEEAIRATRDHGFVQNEAIAHELAAQFYFDRRYQTIAQTYFRIARSCYLCWGAKAKVRQLDQRSQAIEAKAPLHPAGLIGAPVELLDFGSVTKALQAVSGEIVLEKLIEALMMISIQNAGAERGLLILPRPHDHQIEAEARTRLDRVEVHLRPRRMTPFEVPESLIRYVIRTQQRVILDDALVENLFSEDEYLRQTRPRSVLCLPLVKQTRLLGVLYLENGLAPHVFTPGRLTVLELLASQAAISLDNARLYADLADLNAELRQENSDRRRAEEALRASEERLQDIVDNTAAIIFVKDLELRYTLVNHEFERRYRIRRDEIRGKTDFDLHPKDVAGSMRANDLQVIAAGRPIQFEETVPAMEGVRHYVVVKFLLRDGTGQPYAFCGIATDITESKRAAEKIRIHAAKLSQANEVLKRSLTGLARDKDLHRFVDQVLVVLTEQLGGHSSTLWRIDEEQRRAYLQLVCQDGCVVTAQSSGHPNAREPQEWSPDDPGWIALQRKHPFLDYHAVDNARNTPVQKVYLSGLGVESLVWIPLVFGEQLTGMLTVRIAERRRIDEEELEFAQALAQQVTLALELARLAEQTKQSALVIEREQAARARAAELAKANEALLECLDALASVSELDQFLGQVMGAMTRQLSAASSVLFLQNGEDNFLSLDLVFQDGRVMAPAEAKYPERLRISPLDEQQRRVLKKPATVVRLLDDSATIHDSHRSYLLGIGIKTLLIVPLTISNQLIGSLTFRFSEDREFHPEEIEVARALAIQTSLAIQLTRLAKVARQSAVLAERNELAGEIHDSLAQFFTGISMQLGAAREVFKAGSGSVLSYLERASDLAQFGLGEARRSAFSLQPNIIEESGLIEALQKMVERSNIPGRLRCNFHATGVLEESLSSSVQHDLLRIAQEAMSNAVRHAKPTVISVHLCCNPADLVLEVTDNGSGIANYQAMSRDGFGFSNMRARAESIGAQLKVRTAAGCGTTIVVRRSMPMLDFD